MESAPAPGSFFPKNGSGAALSALLGAGSLPLVAGRLHKDKMDTEGHGEINDENKIKFKDKVRNIMVIGENFKKSLDADLESMCGKEGKTGLGDWVGHVSRLKDDRCTYEINYWF